MSKYKLLSVKQFFVLFLIINYTFLIINSVKAQDIHYTQFTLQAQQQSPAATGNFDGDYRFAALYRNQWATINVPYNTLGFSFDMKAYETKKYNSFLGAGATFFFDQAGDAHYRTFYAQIPLAYTLYFPLKNNSTIKIGAGIYAGILQKSLNINQLQFDNQFTGEVYDANIPIAENFGQLNFLKPDIGMGYHMAFNIKQKSEFGVAFGAHHLNNIQESFIDDGLSLKLQKRFAIPAYYKYTFNKKWEVQLDYLFQTQNTLNEHLFGAIASYYIKNNGPAKTAFEFGSYYRYQDAVSTIIRYRKNNFLTGFAYDINISNLKAASNTYGGIELGLVYTIKKIKEPEIKHKRKCFVF